MLDSLEVLLRDVGDLRGGSVPGVHQDGVVWPEEQSQLSSHHCQLNLLVPPLGLFLVHLPEPALWSSSLLVPAYDDSSVAPPDTAVRGQQVSLQPHLLCLMT